MGDEGTSFTIDLPVKGAAEVDAAARSLETLAARLTTQKDAYSQAEKSANLAAKAVERLGLAAEAQRGKLATANDVGDSKGAARAEKMIAALANRQAEAATKAETLKAALASEAATLDKVTREFEKAKKASEDANKAEKSPPYETIARGLRKLGGPLADLGDHVAKVGSGFEKLKKGFGSGAGAIVGTTVLTVALTAAMIAAAAAAVAATIAVAAWAVGLADANRQSSLLAQGMVQSVKGGQALDASIKAISKTLPISNEELASMAKGFAYAGLRGKDLTNALQQSATWAARLKFGPDFQKEMLSLDEQSKVFKANIASTFGGLKIEGLLGALQRMIALFDDTTASGRAIKVVFESIFQPMIDGATDAQFKVEAFFLKLEIWALKGLIWLKPHASLIVKIGEAFAVFAGVLAVVATVAGVVALAAAAIASPIFLIAVAITAAIIAAWSFRDEIGAAFTAVKAFFASLSLADVAADLIAGLVTGITGGGTAVFNAIKGVVMGAIDGAKKLLGIASPSKVFAEIGMQTGAGMEAGVDRSAPGVHNSLESMVEPPAAGAAKAAPAPASGAKGGLDLSGAQFIFHGVKDAEDAESRFGAVLTRLLEGDAAQLGAAVPA
jgi:hypothetical protein